MKSKNEINKEIAAATILLKKNELIDRIADKILKLAVLFSFVTFIVSLFLPFSGFSMYLITFVVFLWSLSASKRLHDSKEKIKKLDTEKYNSSL